MFTLYVARDKRNPRRHDIGSVLCMKTLNNIPNDEVTTIDCSDIASRPNFIRGTPTLVDRETNEIYTGHSALDRLQLLSLYHAEQHGISQASQPKKTDAHIRTGIQQVPALREEEEGKRDHLWETNLTEDMEGEEGGQKSPAMGERKLTSDDLARIVGERQTQMQQGAAPKISPPPPSAPMND